MDWLAPSLSLVVALGILVARVPQKEEAKPKFSSALAVIVALAGAALLAIIGFLVPKDSVALRDSLLFAAVGLAFAGVLGGLERGARQSPLDRMLPLAVGVALLLLFDRASMKDATQSMLGLVFGAGLGGMWLRFSSRLKWPSALAVSLGALGAVSLLGAIGVGDRSALAGSAIGVVLVIAGVCAIGVGEVLERGRALSWGILVVGLLVGAWLVAKRYLFLEDVFYITTLGLALGLAVAWLQEGQGESASEGNMVGFVLSCIVWVAGATIAFGLLKGYGMALLLLVGVGVLAIVGSERGLLSLAPVFGLTIYRLFREQHTDSSRAFDIGQHYAMVGILIGLLLVVALFQWAKAREPGPMVSVAGILAGAMALGSLVMAVVLLGPKGTIGLLMGIGLGPVVLGLRGTRDVGILAIAVGLLAATALCYGPLGPYLDLERGARITLLLWTSGIVLILGAVVRLLGGPIKENQS